MELMSPLVRLGCYHLNVLIYLQSEVYKNSLATSLEVTSITKRLLGDPRIKYSSEVKKKKKLWENSKTNLYLRLCASIIFSSNHGMR